MQVICKSGASYMIEPTSIDQEMAFVNGLQANEV